MVRKARDNYLSFVCDGAQRGIKHLPTNQIEGQVNTMFVGRIHYLRAQIIFPFIRSKVNYRVGAS